MNKRQVLNFGLLIVVILLMFLWLNPLFFERLLIRSWHLMFNEKVTLKSFTLDIPNNWMALKWKKNLNAIRLPSSSGTFSVGFHDFPVTEDMARDKEILVIENGKKMKCEQIQKIEIAGHTGFIGFSLINNEYEAVVSIPDKRLFGRFQGDKTGFEDFVSIMKKASL